jgi:hypothetical protein
LTALAALEAAGPLRISDLAALPALESLADRITAKI